jgi:hypothetical protein
MSKALAGIQPYIPLEEESDEEKEVEQPRIVFVGDS